MSLQRSLRFALAAVVIVVCLWGILSAWRAGWSRLLAQDGRTAQLLLKADSAVNIAPDDSETHSARAFVLLNKMEMDAALLEYERAVALRPRDYILWLELGRARDLADDEEGALAALEQSVKLAPEYAQPRWHLGNVLFRAGRVEEAYGELRRASLSDPTFLPNFIDLVWNASGGDASVVEQVIQPERASWRIALAKFFIKRGKIQEALAQFRAAGGINEQDRQTLLKELLDAKRYSEAYEVWAADNRSGESGIALVTDGGFESKLSRADSGFGWQPARDTPALRISLDRNNPNTGAQSLRVDFSGDSDPAQAILTQLILVEPNSRYRLRFSARTEEIVTGGLPRVGVNDAEGAASGALAQATSLPQDSAGWRQYFIEFATTEATRAVLVQLYRQNCSSAPCPIFGRLWLDDFAIQKAVE